MDNAAIEVEGSVGSVKGAARFRENITADHILHLIIIGLLGVLIYMVVYQENDRERRYTALGAAITQMVEESKRAGVEHARILQNQTVIIDEARVQTYVLTLEPNERKALKLQMPDALRNRVQGR